MALGTREQFVAYLKTLRTEATVKVYERAVRHFEAFLKKRGWTFSNYPPGVLSEFVSWLSANRQPRSTIVYVYGVRQYLQWLQSTGHQIPPYDRQMVLPKVKTEIPLVLSEGALATYIEICKTLDEPYSSAMRLLGFCTLRVKELCRLKMSDIVPTPYGITLLVYESKSGSRPVPTPKGFATMLKAYLQGYRKDIESDWLFPRKGTPEKHINPSQVQRRFRIIRKRLGLVGFTPHTIRRTWLTIMLQKGTDLLTIAKIAGHSNLNTTKVYAIPDDGMLFKAVNQVDIQSTTGGK